MVDAAEVTIMELNIGPGDILGEDAVKLGIINGVTLGVAFGIASDDVVNADAAVETELDERVSTASEVASGETDIITGTESGSARAASIASSGSFCGAVRMLLCLLNLRNTSNKPASRSFD